MDSPLTIHLDRDNAIDSQVGLGCSYRMVGSGKKAAQAAEAVDT